MDTPHAVDEVHKARIAMLLVHGIGQQPPGEFLSGFRVGFSRLLGPSKVSEIVRSDPVDQRRRIYAAEIELDDRKVFLYEVHWADLIADETARGSFDPAQLFLLAWFPWFNKQLNLPGFTSYSVQDVKRWTRRLVPVSVLFFLGYIGLRALPHLSWALDSAIAMKNRINKLAVGMKRINRFGGLRESSGLERSTLKRYRGLHKEVTWRMGSFRERLEVATRRGWLDSLLDKYVGDVVNLVASLACLPRVREDFAAARALRTGLLNNERIAALNADIEPILRKVSHQQHEVLTLADNVRARFERAAWVAIGEDKCTEVQVLAHSLGSLVAYHAMNRGFVSFEGASGKISGATLTRFHTIGSPLEKIHFFWPTLVAPLKESACIHAKGSTGDAAVINADAHFRWTNYYSAADMVSGALRHFQPWGRIANRKIGGLGGAFSAHASYKSSLQFLQAIARALGMKHARSITSLPMRVTSWLWSTAQTLAAPLFVAVICLFGVTFFLAYGAFGGALNAGLVWLVMSSLRLVFPGLIDAWVAAKLVFWLAAPFYLLQMLYPIAVTLPRWAKRAAELSIARWWCDVGDLAFAKRERSLAQVVNKS